MSERPGAQTAECPDVRVSERPSVRTSERPSVQNAVKALLADFREIRQQTVHCILLDKNCALANSYAFCMSVRDRCFSGLPG